IKDLSMRSFRLSGIRSGGSHTIVGSAKAEIQDTVHRSPLLSQGRALDSRLRAGLSGEISDSPSDESAR
ncbi:MAG TPA: hypothetical protein VJ747_10200, partial [Stellaceae bacterium]|nr:hypothetical protein [Stellaceae bacterium]